MNKNVFISYGHNIYDNVIRAVAGDLRKAGFNVFLDIDYLQIGDWEEIIDEHILGSKFFLFMISKRSVSQAGYCLNELCRAGETNSIIIPISLDDSFAPLSINRYQRLMLKDAIDPAGEIIVSKYNELMLSLIKILNGDIQLGYSDDDIMLRNILRPMSAKEDLFHHYKLFCGRRSAFLDFERFVKGDKNILWIPARPGSGKTAFSSMLCWRYPQYIKAIHFCKFNNSDRINAKYILTSLAFHLANAISEYKKRLVELVNIDNLYEKNADRLFEYLFIEPLTMIQLKEPIVIVIDALDECTFRGNNEIANLLARYRDSLPSWLKFVITSRNEVEIRRKLYNIGEDICMSFESSNYEDLKEYYMAQFPNIGNDKLEILLQKSEESFLYASEICKQIKDNKLSLEDINCFPIGIYGFFNDCFSRIFDEAEDKSYTSISFEEARPILELLCIADEPVEDRFLKRVLDIDEYVLRNLLAKLYSLFPIKEHKIEPLHKSLIDWLTNDDDISQKFYIDKQNGYKRLYKYLKDLYDSGSYDNNISVIKKLGSTMISLELYDELASLLDDEKFQLLKIERLKFDSGLELYLHEFEILHKHSPERALALYNRKSFIEIFSKYRRLLYNSGMYHLLKRIGLSIALKQANEDWGLEGEIGKVMYYYIVEAFNDSIKRFKYILKNHPEIQERHDLLAEMYNTKGLSERKLVLFDDAIESLDLAINHAEEAIDLNQVKDSDPAFEQSLAYLIKGKIQAHTLDFRNANRTFRMAIKVLNNCIDDLPECDHKISNVLFLAEEYRVFADALIWQLKLEDAEMMLKNCDEIYSNNKSSIDRYYVRYLYTSLFYKIMLGEGELEDDLLELLKKLADGKFDTGQVYFLLALNALVNNQSPEGLKKAKEYAAKGEDIYFSIDALMEEAECHLLAAMLDELLKGKGEYLEYDEYVDKWIAYIKDIILKRRENA